MKKWLGIAGTFVLLMALVTLAQAPYTTTTNLNMKKPVPGTTQGWDTSLNGDLDQLDGLMGGVNTLTQNRATPSVVGASVWTTNNNSATAITNFTGGFPGQKIYVICGDTNTTLASGTNLTLTQAFSCANDQEITLVLNGTVWTELGRASATLPSLQLTGGGGFKPLLSLTKDIAGANWAITQGGSAWNWFNDTNSTQIDGLTATLGSTTFYHKAYLDNNGVFKVVGVQVGNGINGQLVSNSLAPPEFDTGPQGSAADLLRLANQGTIGAGHPYFLIKNGNGGNQFQMFAWNGTGDEGSLQMIWPGGTSFSGGIFPDTLTMPNNQNLYWKNTSGVARGIGCYLGSDNNVYCLGNSDTGNLIFQPTQGTTEMWLGGNNSRFFGDIQLARTDQGTGFLTRPNVAGLKNMEFSVSGSGLLDNLSLHASQTNIDGNDTVAGSETVQQSVNIGNSLVLNGQTNSRPFAFLNDTAGSCGFDASIMWQRLNTGIGEIFANDCTPELDIYSDTLAATVAAFNLSNRSLTIGGTLNANAAALTNPLPVSSGGTGMTSPTLAAGPGIQVTGTWPNQVITAVPTLPTLNSTTLGFNTTVGATPTVLMQLSVLFPNSGGPWRAQIAYHLYFNFTSSIQAVDCWVTDGTNPFVPMTTANSNGAAGGKTNGDAAGWSSVTYGNGSGQTFYLECQGTSSAAVALGSQPVSGIASDFQILPVAAN